MVGRRLPGYNDYAVYAWRYYFELSKDGVFVTPRQRYDEYKNDR